MHDLGRKLKQSYVIGRVFSPLASAEGHLRNSDRYATAAVAPGLCGGFTACVPVVDLVFGDSGLARNHLRRARHLFIGKPRVPEREVGNILFVVDITMTRLILRQGRRPDQRRTLQDGSEEFCWLVHHC